MSGPDGDNLNTLSFLSSSIFTLRSLSYLYDSSFTILCGSQKGVKVMISSVKEHWRIQKYVEWNIYLLTCLQFSLLPPILYQIYSNSLILTCCRQWHISQGRVEGKPGPPVKIRWTEERKESENKDEKGRKEKTRWKGKESKNIERERKGTCSMHMGTALSAIIFKLFVC